MSVWLDNHGLHGWPSLTLGKPEGRRTLVKPIRVIRGSEKVGMRAGAGQLKDKNVFLDLVDEQPVGRDVTFAVIRPVAGECVVSIGGRQRFAVDELFDDGLQFLNRQMSLDRPLVVAFEGGSRIDGVFHDSRSFQSSLRSVYRLRVGSLAMRSPSLSAATVSALGVCDPSIWKGMRFSRMTVLMYKVMTEDADSPMSSQNRVNRSLVGLSSEIVILAMICSSSLRENVCIIHKTHAISNGRRGRRGLHRI